MTFSFECTCMKYEELKEIREYYRYVGCNFYEDKNKKIHMSELYIKILRHNAQMEHLDLRNFDSFPIYICVKN